MTDRLSWQEKFAAILAFAPDATLNMRAPGDWYVSAGMAIGGDGLLTGTYGNGADPQDAVEDHWSIYTTIERGKYATFSRGETHRRGRWTGFMWVEVSDDEAKVLIERAGR